MICCKKKSRMKWKGIASGGVAMNGVCVFGGGGECVCPYCDVGGGGDGVGGGRVHGGWEVWVAVVVVVLK